MDNKSLKQWVKLTSKIKKLEQEKAELLGALKECVSLLGIANKTDKDTIVEKRAKDVISKIERK